MVSPITFSFIGPPSSAHRGANLCERHFLCRTKTSRIQGASQPVQVIDNFEDVFFIKTGIKMQGLAWLHISAQAFVLAVFIVSGRPIW
jgi:hypothetical protein